MTTRDAKRNLYNMKAGETLLAGNLAITFHCSQWLVRNESTQEQALCEIPEQVIEFMKKTGLPLESWF